MNIKLSEEATERLLYNLCVKLGFCLPPPLIKRIINSPPRNVDRFTDIVYKGEGLDPALKTPLYQQVHEIVAEAFQQHEE